MEVVVFILYLFALSLLILRNNFFRVEGIKKPLLVCLWGLKILVGVCFYLIFNSASYKDVCYSSDFFKSSEKLFWLHKREPVIFKDIMLGVNTHTQTYKTETLRISDKWYQENENNLVNDNRTVIRLNTLLHFISFHFYSIHLLFMSFLSFIGSVLLFKAFPKRGRKEIYASAIACFLVPSLIFWSIGVLKEPLLLLGLGGFLFSFRKITREFSFLTLFLLILSCALLMCIKMYVFVVVLPMSLIFFWCQHKHRFIVLKYLVATIVLSTFCLLSHVCFPEQKMDLVKTVTAQNQRLFNTPAKSDKITIFKVPHLECNIESLLKNTPLAMYNSLTKPFFYPVKDFVQLLINIETILLALLLIVCLIFGNYKRFSRDNFAIFSVILCVYGFILIGLTTNDMGTIMRNKSVFLPFYVYGLIHLLDTDRVLYFFKIQKRRKDKNFDLVKNFEERIGKMAR